MKLSNNFKKTITKASDSTHKYTICRTYIIATIAPSLPTKISQYKEIFTPGSIKSQNPGLTLGYPRLLMSKYLDIFGSSESP